MLISNVQQSLSAMHIHASMLCQSYFPLRFSQYWVEFPVLYSRFLLVICFKYNSVFISILSSYLSLLRLYICPDNHEFILLSLCVCFCFVDKVFWVFFFRFRIETISYIYLGTVFFLTRCLSVCRPSMSHLCHCRESCLPETGALRPGPQMSQRALKPFS